MGNDSFRVGKLRPVWQIRDKGRPGEDSQRQGELNGYSPSLEALKLLAIKNGKNVPDEIIAF
jgi:hypothetical protein